MLLRAAVVALAIGLAGCGSPHASPSAAGPSSVASASPSAAAAVTRDLPGEGEALYPGTYTGRFQPALTLVVGDGVNLDCAPGFRCRAEVNVNDPDWLALDFGHDHGAEMNIFSLDQLYDPQSPGSLIEPPDDLASLITALPGFTVVEAPAPTTVGGLAATAFTVQSGDDGVQIGTNDSLGAGLAPNAEVRYIALKVDGRAVLISMGIDNDNITHDFGAAVDVLQPVVDSIQWL
jgi:hypothetical protein